MMDSWIYVLLVFLKLGTFITNICARWWNCQTVVHSFDIPPKSFQIAHGVIEFRYLCISVSLVAPSIPFKMAGYIVKIAKQKSSYVFRRWLDTICSFSNNMHAWGAKKSGRNMDNYVVVSSIFSFHPLSWGNDSILTNDFSNGLKPPTG